MTRSRSCSDMIGSWCWVRSMLRYECQIIWVTLTKGNKWISMYAFVAAVVGKWQKWHFKFRKVVVYMSVWWETWQKLYCKFLAKSNSERILKIGPRRLRLRYVRMLSGMFFDSVYSAYSQELKLNKNSKNRMCNTSVLYTMKTWNKKCKNSS